LEKKKKQKKQKTKNVIVYIFFIFIFIFKEMSTFIAANITVMNDYDSILRGLYDLVLHSPPGVDQLLYADNLGRFVMISTVGSSFFTVALATTINPVPGGAVLLLNFFLSFFLSSSFFSSNNSCLCPFIPSCD